MGRGSGEGGGPGPLGGRGSHRAAVLSSGQATLESQTLCQRTDVQGLAELLSHDFYVR